MPRKARTSQIPDGYVISPDGMSDIIINNTPKFQKSWRQKRPYASQTMCARMTSFNAIIPDRWTSREPSMHFYASSGNAMEAAVNKVFERAGVFICTGWKMPQELFEGKFDIGGMLDTLLWINDGQDLAIVEQKCIGSIEPTKRVSLNHSELLALSEGNEIVLNPSDNRVKKLPSARPKESYKAQAEIYSAITGINNAFIGLFSRNIVDNWMFDEDNHVSHRFFPIDISDENLAKRVASVIYSIKCVDEGYVAEKPKDIVQSHCHGAFCDFMDYCWKDDSTSLPKELKSFNLVPIDLSSAWKKEAYSIALDYISRRPQRYEQVKELMRQIPIKSKK